MEKVGDASVDISFRLEHEGKLISNSNELNGFKLQKGQTVRFIHIIEQFSRWGSKPTDPSWPWTISCHTFVKELPDTAICGTVNDKPIDC